VDRVAGRGDVLGHDPMTSKKKDHRKFVLTVNRKKNASGAIFGHAAEIDYTR
jgi:hypothetical protein